MVTMKRAAFLTLNDSSSLMNGGISRERRLFI